MPPNQVLVGFALFLSLFVMAPTLRQINHDALQPYLAHKIEAKPALLKAEIPIKRFMLKQTRASDLALFLKLAHEKPPKTRDQVSTHDARARVHDLGAEDGVRDRVPGLRAVPDHRPRDLVDADVHGHDDAAACPDLAAVQDPAVRARRRLGAARRRASSRDSTRDAGIPADAHGADDHRHARARGADAGRLARRRPARVRAAGGDADPGDDADVHPEGRSRSA